MGSLNFLKGVYYLFSLIRTKAHFLTLGGAVLLVRLPTLKRPKVKIMKSGCLKNC